ncbi:MAG: G5 domain-containing protein [Bacillota bacterium]
MALEPLARRALRNWARPLVIALSLLGVASGAVAAGNRLVTAMVHRRSVRVMVDGQVHASLSTRARTVAEALAEAGVTLGPEDQVQPTPEQPLADKAENVVRVRRARPWRVEADGAVREGLSAATGVTEVLQAFGVTLDEDDRVQVQPRPDGGFTARVIRVREEVVTETEEIPFETLRRPSDQLEVGQVREVRAGVPGLLERKVRLVYENGELVAREVIGEAVVREPVDRILAYGTVGTVARGGQVYRYRKVLEMRATAYAPGDGNTPGQYTATGVLARKGVAAVDPRVIPLGTRLYVDGYGPAIAADTGGAVKGNRIDLAFDTPEEARAFGVRTVKVYILE